MEEAPNHIHLSVDDVSAGPSLISKPISRRPSFVRPEPRSPLRLNSAIQLNSTPDKFSYRTVDALIRQIYNDTNTVRSTALDILATWLKGQKLLYTEAKTFCERRLIALMLPTIAVSAACSVIGLALDNVGYGKTIVASFNALNAFILGVISYLKLDAKAEAHKTAAYKYDKLQAYCEFKSGKVLFFAEEGKEDVTKIIDEIESGVSEIKETNQFILPEWVRYSMREIYGANVFSTVKKIQSEEMILINRLKGLINALITLNTTPGTAADEILKMEAHQNETINQIIELRNQYLSVDKRFETEIEKHIRRGRSGCNCLQWLNT